jgi:4-amino-4-deoxy-L-arabinose transferase-like glycosyltransferase
MSPARASDGRRPVNATFAMVLALQMFLAVSGVADQWTRGHNGWNGAAYHNAARNTLRWGVLFPLQYETANVPPKKEQLYTHAPLALHLHNVASVKLLGDRESSIRLVAGFWSVASLCMLFAVVRRLWDDQRAVAASAIYVALPINAIYINMANHSAGFIFWALLTVLLYVNAPRDGPWRWRRLGPFLFAFMLAATWDWPAYYVAACIAFHWAWRVAHARDRMAARKSMAQLAIFCVWVFVLFAGHFVLVQALTGNLDELTGTFNARRALSWARFQTHLLTVPELMFTAPVLGLCAGWVAFWVVRAARGHAQDRDLIPIAFLTAGLIHYWTFRWSAIVHSYWAWPILPGVAIIVATSSFAIGAWVRARAGLLLSVAVLLLLLLPLAFRVVDIVPEGRRVGGSMWFLAPVRGAIESYDSGRSELRLAARVKSRTDRETGVQLHTSLKPRRLEPRFDITLDRVTHRWSQKPRIDIPNNRGVSGWVFVAAIDAFSEQERAELAAQHPYEAYGEYFILDLRRHESEITAWALTPEPFTAPWWLFHSPFEPEVRETRVVAVEQSLHKKVLEADAP